MNGFEVVCEADGRKGMERALSDAFDLILLDLMLPGIDGYEICRNIRPKIDAPILMVTARVEDADKVRGLGIGADDYIAKPFSPTELTARVKANIAQYERLKQKEKPAYENEKEIDLCYNRINPSTRYVYACDKEVELKNKEYELLYFLASNAEIVFSKDHLYEMIWGMDAFGDTKTVAVHISRLREKIEKDPSNPEHLQTVWGAGYRFRK
jgi:DNA-binding response OmpR family regulator